MQKVATRTRTAAIEGARPIRADPLSTGASVVVVEVVVVVVAVVVVISIGMQPSSLFMV